MHGYRDLAVDQHEHRGAEIALPDDGDAAREGPHLQLGGKPVELGRAQDIGEERRLLKDFARRHGRPPDEQRRTNDFPPTAGAVKVTGDQGSEISDQKGWRPVGL